ncbi:MAG: NACHT domain-containing protein [Alcaligenaceae bacterium]|nr:MAG: NACHT domain-containing protein [Alcaligenaceae bacterium]
MRSYQSLLNVSRQRFKSVWTNASEARSWFGQNVAGGIVPTIHRQPTMSGLESWWLTEQLNAAVIHGGEGMGKTWAAIQWAEGKLETLPIVLMLPASAFKELKGMTYARVLALIADAFSEMIPGPERSYWQARLRRLLTRPVDEGPAVLLLVDGLNQEPSFEWERLLQILEGNAFNRVRLIVTAQTHFLRERLQDFRRLSNRPRELEVGPYDLSPGGEFDTLLKLHGLDRGQLPEGVIELARIPRFFTLAIHQNKAAALEGKPTPGRLLWAHAKDELGLKAKGSLSESDWEVWLQGLATQYLEDILAGRAGARGYSSRELGDMIRDPAGSTDETARRLHEISVINQLMVGTRLRPPYTVHRTPLNASAEGQFTSNRAIQPGICNGIDRKRILDRQDQRSRTAFGGCMNSMVAPSGPTTYITRVPARAPPAIACGVPCAFQP